MLKRIHFNKFLGAIARSLFWGGMMPVLFFELATWIDKQFWMENIYYGFTPAAVPIYCGFFITSFPGLIFLIVLGWLDIQYSMFTSLGWSSTPLPVFIVLTLIVNIVIHWFFWYFVWKRKLVPQNNSETGPHYNLKIIWANLLGITFLFFAVIEFLMIRNNQNLLISNFGLLTLGLCLLVFANTNWKVNKEGRN